jgi:peptidoglycan hydrolase-like protein with peptidoglycan-binding domain
VPATGQVPPWPLLPGHYFGLITGPPVSHGGYNPADRGWVQQIQQALIRKGFVPGITGPDPGWADGTYGASTRQAVLRFQRSTGENPTGDIYPGDWARLLS